MKINQNLTMLLLAVAPTAFPQIAVVTPPVQIASVQFNPPSQLVITGKNFGAKPGTVQFALAEASPTNWSDTNIQIALPTTNPPAATYNLTVTSTGNATASFPVTISYASVSVGVAYANVNLSAVQLNNRGNQIHVAPGDTFTVTATYTIANYDWCPGCIDQIEIGIAGAPGPQKCLYDGLPSVAPGDTGTNTVTLTAPMNPGTYYVAADRSLDFGCLVSGPNWWLGPPTPDRYIATIVVN